MWLSSPRIVDPPTRAAFSENVKQGAEARGLTWPFGPSDAALNAAWARRVGLLSHLPRSARVPGRLGGRYRGSDAGPDPAAQDQW